MLPILLAALAAPAAVPPAPSQQEEVGAPASCASAKSAMLDQQAAMFGLFAPGTHPGPLGQQYLKLSEDLSAAMTADDPDLTKIAGLWREVERVKAKIGAVYLALQTECTLDKLKAMPPEERKAYLRAMAPMTRAERGQVHPVPPVSPPQPKR